MDVYLSLPPELRYEVDRFNAEHREKYKKVMEELMVDRFCRFIAEIAMNFILDVIFVDEDEDDI